MSTGLKSEAGDAIGDWLGPGTKVITNDEGDKIFVSGDGKRKVRVDLNNPSPHENPHSHAEEKKSDGTWDKSGPIYPKDVPKE
jgi:hypothetical protein